MGAVESVKKEFDKVEACERVQCVLDLAASCSYDQRVELHARLQAALFKDLITHLPAGITARVLSYLSFEDATNCLMVSKSWSDKIGGCTEYWLTCAKAVGLGETFVSEKLPKCRGVRQLCVSALKHRKALKALTVRGFTVSTSKIANSHSYRYAGNGIALRYEELNSHAQVVIESISMPHSCLQIASFEFPAFSSRVKWVSASPNYVLWKQVDGKWNGCSTTDAIALLEQWEDEPISQGFSSISFCSHCHLVAVVSEAEDDCELWDLQVIKLLKGNSSARKMVYPIPLERLQSTGLQKRLVMGGNVHLSSVSTEVDSTGFCTSHRVFLQIGSHLAVHQLDSNESSKQMMLIHQLLPDAKLSKPLKIFGPNIDNQPLNMMETSGPKCAPYFCISMDFKCAGLIHDSYLYVWNLATFVEESCVDLIRLKLPVDIKCVALGSLYAVVASNSRGTCAVVSITSGELLLQGSFVQPSLSPDSRRSQGRSTRYDFHPPVKQAWLSSFQKFESWPIAVAFDYFESSKNPNTELALQNVLGVLNVPKTRPLSLLEQ